MQKTLKAAVAAFSGGVLLLGGASTLAFWNDDEDAPGTTIDSGQLDLSAYTCDDWLLDDATVFEPLADVLVPGDSLTRSCTSTITATGDHMEADLTVAAPALSGGTALDAEMTVSAAYTLDDNLGGGPVALPMPASITEADNTKTLGIVITVDFPFGLVADNTTQGLEATLDAITVTATQTDFHNP